MYIWFLFRQLQNKWQFSITTNWLFIFLKFITPAFNSPHPHSPKKTTTTNNNNNNNNKQQQQQQQQQQNNNTKQHKKSNQKRSSLLVLSEMRHWMVVNWSSALWGCTEILLGAMLWVQLNSLLSYLPLDNIKVFQLKGYKHLKACIQ